MIDLRHRRLRREVEAYVDGYVVSPDRAAVVRAHLEQCWDCSGDADTLRLVKAVLRRRGRLQPTSLSAARLRQWAETALR